MLYLLSYTGRWWGCLDSNQGTQRERIYSPPQLPLCHIPIPFSSRCSGPLLTAAEGIIRYGQDLVNVIHLAGRIHITVSPYWLVAVSVLCDVHAGAGRCTGLHRKKVADSIREFRGDGNAVGAAVARDALGLLG